jgi:hypothetical protein
MIQMNRAILTLCIAGALAFATASPSQAGTVSVDGRTWSPPAPLSTESAPALHSAPALSVNGAYTALAWTDSRNASPDVYAAVFSGNAGAANKRVTNIGPEFDTQRAFGASVTVEPSGRAFAAYSDGTDIFVARYDVASGQWLSRTQVTAGLNGWHQVARFPDLASDGNGNLIIAWEDFRNNNPDNDFAASKGSDIYAGTCNGNTMTCSASNVKVNDDSTKFDQRRPRLARNGNIVALIWEDHRERGAELPRVYAAFSSNGGQSFGGNLRVNLTPAGSADPNSRDTATLPAIAITGDGTVVAAWEGRAGSATSPADIFAAWWNGAAWSAPQRVDAAPARARAVAPRIAASNAGIFVAWQDHRNGANNPDIYTAKWNGSNWVETPAVIQPGQQTWPVIAGSGDAMRLAWQDGRIGTPRIYSATWSGNGWSGVQPASDQAARAPYQMSPDLASDGSNTFALVLDGRMGYKQLWLAQLTGLGLPAWGNLIPLPTHARDDGDISTAGAALAGDNGALHAAWSEYVYPHGRQIFYSSYRNGQWSEAQAITNLEDGGAERHSPALAVRGNTVVAVWSERGDNTLGNLYASVNTGNGWSTPAPVLQQAIDEWRIFSAVALDSNNNIFVAYSLSDNNGRGRLMMAKRNAGGGAWSHTQVSPTVNSNWCEQRFPHVRAGADNVVHVVWSGCALRNPPNEWPHDSFVFYANSNNAGASFSQPIRVGRTVPQNDEANHNDTYSRPALALGNSGEVMVLYPAILASGSYAFFAALMQNGAFSAPAMVSSSAANWARPDEYFGEWYAGDSRGAVIFDAPRLRYVVAYPDRSNGRSPRILTAAYGDINLKYIFLPSILR